MKPNISVIVPLQEHLCFDETLKALAEQENIALGEYEVIAIDSLYLRDWSQVVDDVKHQYPDLQLTFIGIERTRSRAKQLNIGIEKAKADVILLLADDFIPCPQLVSLHLQSHAPDTREDMVSIGPGLFPKDRRTNDFMHWLEDSGELFGVSFTDPEFQLPPYYFYMANTSLKRSFLKRAGSFDEDFPYDAMDDWEMGKRLLACGMRNHYLPDAVATHEHIISLEERCKAMRQAGESSAIYDAKSSQPGPWAASVFNSKIPYSRRKRESREQRYKRVVSSHWRKGYEIHAKMQARQRQQAETTKD